MPETLKMSVILIKVVTVGVYYDVTKIENNWHFKAQWKPHKHDIK